MFRELIQHIDLSILFLNFITKAHFMCTQIDKNTYNLHLQRYNKTI